MVHKHDDLFFVDDVVLLKNDVKKVIDQPKSDYREVLKNAWFAEKEWRP